MEIWCVKGMYRLKLVSSKKWAKVCVASLICPFKVTQLWLELGLGLQLGLKLNPFFE